MKKSLYFLLVIIALSWILVSCQFIDSQHNHKYSRAWTTSDTEHWRVASCEHTDLFVNKGEHTFDDGFVTKSPTEYDEGIKTFTCTVCKFERTELISRLAHTHKFDTEEYVFNEDYHWKNATCEHTTITTDAEAHRRVGNNVCVDCGHMAVSEGLAFTLLSNGTYEVSGRGANKDSCIVVPATHEGKPVTSIGARAFSNELEIIRKIKLPSSITTIGAYAFATSFNFEEVIFDGESNLESIGEYAFYNCARFFTAFTIPKTVTQIGEAAFMSCKGLTNLTIEEGNTNCKIIDGTLYTADGTKLLQYNLSSEATEFVVPDTVTTLGVGAFAYSPYLEKITFSAENTMTAIAEKAFHFSVNIKEIQLPLGITAIGESAFDRCLALTTINIPANLITIGNYAFNCCESLSEFAIPSTVKNIGSYAFALCKQFTRFDIPNGVTILNPFMLNGCSSLTEVTIPKSVTSCREKVFYGTSALCNIIVDEANTRYKSIDGNLYSKDGKTFIHYCAGKAATDFTLPSTVTKINESAFFRCTNLVNVTLQSGLKTIGTEAFWQCSNIKSITLPEGVTSVGTAAFRECKSLSEFVIPSTLTTLPENMLQECHSLKTIVVPETVTTINRYALGNLYREYVEFKNPNGWSWRNVTDSGTYEGVFDAEELTDPEKAATIVMNHAGCVWTRSDS